MKKLFNFDEPIIISLLETDTYKIRMLYYIWTFFPQLKTKFAFRNRTSSVQLAKIIDIVEVREQFDAVADLRFSDNEIEFLRQNEKYPEDFLLFLKNLKLSNILVEDDKNGQLIIETATDDWVKTTLWELITLPIVNELYARQTLINDCIFDAVAIAEGEKRLLNKVNLLKGSGVKALQFGLRRRLSGLWERHMTEMALDLMPDCLVAISNINLARELDVPYGGTNAHELSMALNALRWSEGSEAARYAQYEVFEKWFELFDGDQRIILPDTFGSKQFLDNIPGKLAEEAMGFREDSGDPIEFGNWVIDMWFRMNIDAKERKLFFSDGLIAERMLKLDKCFRERTNILFGWGTNFSNDTGFVKPLSIVMKLVQSAGNPAIKLSDNIAKAIGDRDMIARNKKLFGYDVTLNEACLY